MPRVKPVKRFKGPKIWVETDKGSGVDIRCLVCGYRGQGDVVKIHKRRSEDREIHRCPECKSLKIVSETETIIMEENNKNTVIIPSYPPPPQCPEHGDMVLVELTQGAKLLGFLWFCNVESCQSCEDYDPKVYGERAPQFLEQEEETPEVPTERKVIPSEQLPLFGENYE